MPAVLMRVLTKLAAKTYDLVVSDYEMPHKNGLDFLQELRQNKNLTPFILFTGKGREEIAIKALNLGADGYINKQGNPETVYGELAHAIKISAERSQIKKELLERDTRILKLASQTPGMLFQFKRRPNGTYCVPFTSDSIRNIFGCTPQDVSEDFSPITKVIFPEDLEKLGQSIEESAAHLTPWHLEYRVQVPGKPIRWLWGQSIPEKQEDGSIIWNGYNADITENKKMEEKLKANEKKYDTLVNATNTGYVTLDGKGLVLDANLEYVRLTGHKTLDQIKGRSVTEWTAKHDLKRNAEEVKKCYQEGFVRNLEIDYVDENGKITPIEINATVLGSEQDSVIVTLCRDITERKRAEEKLNEIISNEKFLADFVRNSSVAIAVGYRDGRVGQFNLAFEKLTGYSEMELREG